MKKTIAILGTMLMCASFTACGSNTTIQQTQQTTKTTTNQTQVSSSNLESTSAQEEKAVNKYVQKFLDTFSDNYSDYELVDYKISEEENPQVLLAAICKQIDRDEDEEKEIPLILMGKDGGTIEAGFALGENATYHEADGIKIKGQKVYFSLDFLEKDTITETHNYTITFTSGKDKDGVPYTKVVNNENVVKKSTESEETTSTKAENEMGQKFLDTFSKKYPKYELVDSTSSSNSDDLVSLVAIAKKDNIMKIFLVDADGNVKQIGPIGEKQGFYRKSDGLKLKNNKIKFAVDLKEEKSTEILDLEITVTQKEGKKGTVSEIGVKQKVRE